MYVCGGSVVVLCCLFLKSGLLWRFNFRVILVRLGLLGGRLLGNGS